MRNRVKPFIKFEERKMEIPGIAPFSNQPTLTNPLSQSESLKGQETTEQSGSETSSTVTASEQETTGLSNTTVTNQVNETAAANNSGSNIGATIDITV
jgi:hypothetical protein